MLLALDTATDEVGVALWGDDGPVASCASLGGRRHGELLAPAIRDLLAGAGCDMADLTAVAVDVGPGLFTGLRVGVATAKALASALGLPVVGVTSLEILAHPHRRQPAVVAAVVDARRHEVFRALYQPVDGTLVEIAAPAVVTPVELVGELADLGRAVLAVGDGARRYADGLLATGVAGPAVLPAGIRVAGPADAYPSATVLAELAADRIVAGEVGEAVGLRPCYLRQADVRIGWEQRSVAPTGGPSSSEPNGKPTVAPAGDTTSGEPTGPKRGPGISRG